MKATLRAERRYALTIDGVETDGWYVEDRWEGLMKLRRGDQVVIVTEPSPMDEMFSDVFSPRLRGDGKSRVIEVDVIKASPSVIASAQESGK